MSDKKDKDMPDSDDLQKMIKDMFGKMGGGMSMPFPGFSHDEEVMEPEEVDSDGMEMRNADAVVL